MFYSIQGNYYKKNKKSNYYKKNKNCINNKTIETFEHSADLQNISYQRDDDQKYVWCVNDRNRLAVRDEVTGKNWTSITGGIKKINSSAIAYIWGISDDNQVYRCSKNCTTGSFEQPDKDVRLKQLSADKEYVWGVDLDGYVHKAPNDGSVPFLKISEFTNVAASRHGSFYGVNSIDEIYQCKQIPGNLKQLDADKNELWGVDHATNIYKCATPCEGKWEKMGSKFKYVSAAPGKRNVWAIGTNDHVFKCRKPCKGKWEEVDGRIKDIG